jgi:hypothetical protein
MAEPNSEMVGNVGRDAITRDFRSTDWSFLLDAAVLHGLFWRGFSSASSEFRLRVAKFGATPQDRARLRQLHAHYSFAGVLGTQLRLALSSAPRSAPGRDGSLIAYAPPRNSFLLSKPSNKS